jgi:hypothetical protein
MKLVSDDPIIKQFFLETNPNPSRLGCPGNTVLRSMAAGTLPSTDPARLHLSACSPCFAEFLELQQAKQKIRKPPTKARLLIAAAAAAACVISTVWVARTETSPIPLTTPQLAVLDRTVDLFYQAPVRGKASSPSSPGPVLLPAALVRVTVILPVASDGGEYRIAVTRDQDGKSIVASGIAPSAGEGPRKTVTVILDLRAAHGTVLLKTTDRNDISYLYPMRIG